MPKLLMQPVIKEDIGQRNGQFTKLGISRYFKSGQAKQASSSSQRPFMSHTYCVSQSTRVVFWNPQKQSER